MAGIFSTLKVEIERTGEIIPITCVGQENLMFRINEVAAIPGVRIAGVDSDNSLNGAMQQVVNESGATVTTT